MWTKFLFFIDYEVNRLLKVSKSRNGSMNIVFRVSETKDLNKQKHKWFKKFAWGRKSEVGRTGPRNLFFTTHMYITYLGFSFFKEYNVIYYFHVIWKNSNLHSPLNRYRNRGPENRGDFPLVIPLARGRTRNGGPISWYQLLWTIWDCSKQP